MTVNKKKAATFRLLKDNPPKVAKWTCIYYYIFTAKSLAGKKLHS